MGRSAGPLQVWYLCEGTYSNYYIITSAYFLIKSSKFKVNTIKKTRVFWRDLTSCNFISERKVQQRSRNPRSQGQDQDEDGDCYSNY
jgi:hypothetical protein